MSNPTIDGVPVSRELIAEALEGMSTTAGRRALRPKLRALLGTPACDTPAGHVCPGQGVGACKQCPTSQPLGEIDLTPKRLAHAESVIERQNNLIASLRAELSESYRIGAKPQGELVAHCLLRRNGAGEWVNDAKSWADGVPCREIVAECETHPELYRVRLAYAEQPAPVAEVHPFAATVIHKLQRFQECADDGQGADIGRRWFDLLTQLGLLNRVKRSPALWELTQQGEDVLAAERARQGAPFGSPELAGVAAQLRENTGFWSTCSGCYEAEDGHAVGSYSYSETLNCALGSGCRECGGLGAVWDNANYEEMIQTWLEDVVPAPTGRAPFEKLCYGAKFKYSEEEAAVWVKIGHDLIAGWDASKVSDSWVGQPVCSFSDDGDLSVPVYLVPSSPETKERWYAAADVDQHVRELDVLINGEDGAAPQGRLCDLVAQLSRQPRKRFSQ